MSNKFQEHCLTHWHTALPVRRGEMVHQIRPGNKSEFAFMTRINSITPKLSTRFQSICRCCDNPNFSYYCSVYDKVFIETLQPEIHVRKISVKKNNQKEHLSPIHRGSHKCRNSLLKISWLMMVEYEYWQIFHWGSIDCINSYHLPSHFKSGLGLTQASSKLHISAYKMLILNLI